METISEQIILNRYEFTQEFKDQICFQVLYECRNIDELVKEYEIPSNHTLILWIRNYKKRLEEGMITLPAMTEEQKKNLVALQKRNKELESALEKANVLIYAMNAIIDYAEKEYNIPIRKKRGTKQSK
jgi:transposase